MSGEERCRGQVLRLLLATVLAVAPAVALEVPYLTGRVNDHAGLLSGEQRESLENLLAELEKNTTAQVAVLTIPSLEGENLEEYSLRVADTWKLGQREKDNGVLFLISTGDRAMRLEVGYGLEGVLPDATCRRILDGLVRPRFRAGDFPGGIEAGVQAVAGVIAGDENALGGAEAAGEELGIMGRVIASLVVVPVLGTFSLTALFSPGFGGWFLYLFLIPFWAVFPTILFTPYVGLPLLAIWLIGFPILKIWLRSTPAGKAFLKARPGLARFASSMASSGGSSGRSGGFSGGGGSFGGGGASSRW
ncbi:MAG: TPM domain-containing protein [Acidobacteriota bacterium]|jgi:uncharacterized protein